MANLKKNNCLKEIHMICIRAKIATLVDIKMNQVKLVVSDFLLFVCLFVVVIVVVVVVQEYK